MTNIRKKLRAESGNRTKAAAKIQAASIVSSEQYRMFGRIKQILWGALFGTLIATQALGQTATLLPNAKQQFFTPQGIPAAAGTVDMYVPSTTTRKTTWKSSTESVGNQNTNPVLLDAGGFATIYGDGAYRQVVKDGDGNTIWDAVTASTGSGGGGGGTPSSEGVMVGTIILWTNTTLPAQYLYTAGQTVSRTTYSALLTAITYSTVILCSTGISSITVPVAISDSVPIGAPLEAACFPPGTIISSKSSGQLTLSTSATATVSVSAQIFPWGNGNGSTTFTIPDLRGRVIAGRDNMLTAAGRLTTSVYGTNPDASGAIGGNQTTTLVTANLPPYTPAGTNGNSTSSGLFLQGGVSDNFASIAGSGQFDNLTKANVVAPGSIFTGTAQGGISTPFRTIQPTVTADYIIKAFPDDSPSGPGVSSIGGMTGAIACGTNITCTANTISIGSFANGLPLIGLGAGQPIGTGSKTSTNGSTLFMTGAGSYTDENCLKSVNGNAVTTGLPCNTGVNTSNVQDFLAGVGFTAGTTTSLTTSSVPIGVSSSYVLFDGVVQSHNTYSLAGSTFSFSSAIPLNTLVVEIGWLSTFVVPTWVTTVNGMTGAVVTGNNLIKNAGMGLTTQVSTVLVGTPASRIRVTSFAQAGGAGSNNAQFTTVGGNAGLQPGKMVTILGTNTANISATCTITSGNTITCPAGTFTQAQGDLLWITGGTNSSARTQYRVVSNTGGGAVLTVNGGLVNQAAVTVIATAIQGGYAAAVDPTVNGIPQAGNPFAPAFFYYVLQVTAVGVDFFNAQLAGHNLNVGASSLASAFEVTNGNQNTGCIGPDWWSCTLTVSYYKMRGTDWDGTTSVVKPGAIYSAKLIKGAATQEFFWQDLAASAPGTANISNSVGLAALTGQAITCGAFIKTPNAFQGRIFLYDGITRTYGQYVTAGSLQWVEVGATFSAVLTAAQFGISLDAGAIGDTFFVTQPICMIGSGTIGVGHYQPAPPILHMFVNHTNPFYYINQAVPANTFINIESETSGAIPSGWEAIHADIGGYNTNVLGAIYLADSPGPPTTSSQMSACVSLNPAIGAVNVNQTCVVGITRRASGDGQFIIDSQYINTNGSAFWQNATVDYLGGLY